MMMRIWPGVVAAILMVLVRFIAPLVSPDQGSLLAVLAPLGGGVLILLWWLFFSRVRWAERLGVLAVLIAAGYLALFIVHPSIRGGLMGMMVPFALAIPGLSLALVVWASLTRRAGFRARYAAFAGIVAATLALFAMVRTDGIFGGVPRLTWRWTPTAEDRLLARAANDKTLAAPATVPAAPAEPAAPAAPDSTAASPTVVVPSESGDTSTATRGEGSVPSPPVAAPENQEIRWPGFRGRGRDGVIRGVQIATDWAASPPIAIWKRPIGPAWSSFAIAGDFLYTQEQRGEHEIVACYRASTGEPVWMHKDAVRFYESNGGAGPRATPALSGGRVFALGATGILNALDAATGARVWSRHAGTDTGVPVPGWGFTGSPLVVGDIVVVAASGALAAYDLASGNPRWTVKSAGGSYSSPHLATLGGTPQILLLAGSGLVSVSPLDGAVLWKYGWNGAPIVQPTVLADGDILVTTSDAMGGLGVRRLAVARGGDGWTVHERWTSNTLKPYFNDYVVHEGHAYGFDGAILACIDLSTGSRKWKGGRYGNGQMILLADQDLLIVLSEEGELALVKATPDGFTEVAARIPAIEGRTWTHPALVGDVLFVRNGEEMAAFRLPRAARTRRSDTAR